MIFHFDPLSDSWLFSGLMFLFSFLLSTAVVMFLVQSILANHDKLDIYNIIY